MSKKISLTGVKPTDVPHLGNYLGAIKPAIELAREYQGICFIADYHALTTSRDAKKLQQNVYDVTASWLAAGLDPKETIMFRQSQVIEVFELAWVLSCVVATGQLERGHAFKDASSKGDSPNAGIFFYPVLMAADILLYDADVVPVGRDQKQHLELARDMANRLNHHYGENTVIVPKEVLSESQVVPGLDGEKMSKSRGNTIPILASEKEMRKAVMKMVTGSEPLEAPKEAEGTTLFELFKHVSTADEQAELKKKLAAGNYGWGHAKQDLVDALERTMREPREKFLAMRADEAALDRILEEGAERARERAQKTMQRVRSAIGIAR